MLTENGRSSCRSRRCPVSARRARSASPSAACGVGEVRADHEELVAADAGHAVLRADRVGQALGGREQQTVADLVAERVVDVLEPVEVDEDRGHVARSSPLVGQRVRECREDLASVGEPGERVVRRRGGAGSRPCSREIVTSWATMPTNPPPAMRRVVPGGERRPEDPVFARGVDVVDVALPDAVGRAVDEVARRVVEHRSEHRRGSPTRCHGGDGLGAEELEGGLVRRRAPCRRDPARRRGGRIGSRASSSDRGEVDALGRRRN